MDSLALNISFMKSNIQTFELSSRLDLNLE